MSRVWIAVGVVVASWGFASGVSAADAQRFDQLLKDATPIADQRALGDLIEPLFASCDQADELLKRQCEVTRDFLVANRSAWTYVSVGDTAALTFAPYDPLSKAIEATVVGCIACGKPLKHGDKLRFVTTKVPKAIKQGKALGLDVGLHELGLRDVQSAKIFEKKVVPRLRVQYVWKLGAPWKSGPGFEGVSFAPVAYRIFDRCTGQIYASNPPSLPTDKVNQYRDATCPAPEDDLTDEERQAKAERAQLPLQLSRQQIEATMAPMQERAHDCFVEFEVGGTATVDLHVLGSGKVETVGLSPPFDKTPVGYCLKTAISRLTFPEFRGEKMKIRFPLYLR